MIRFEIRLVKLLIVLFTISFRLYPQLDITIPLDYDDFLKTYLKTEGLYNNLSEETINGLTHNAQINNIFQQWKGQLKYGELLAIIREPNSILTNTTNENIILIFGTTIGYLEAANMQLETALSIANSLKSKISFNANSGNNNGLLIPMHTPLGSFGINLYVDTPIFNIQKAVTYPIEADGKQYESVSDFKSISDAVKYIPIPHLNAYFQINWWHIPMSLTLRGGGALGFKGLFGTIINDVEIEAIGYNFGLSLKAFLFRTKYFFGDFRTDFNFESGKIGLDVKKRYIYIPIRLGYRGGTDTGVVFNGNAFLESKWKAYAISPKVVVGFKFKERVPKVQYFSAYFSLGADITYGIVDSQIGINGIGSYANIVGHTLEINDLNVPNSFDKRDFWHYDMRIGFHFYIFFQSISIEYAIFGKQFAFQIIPINIRF